MSSKAEYSKQCIYNALVDLLQKYPIDTITISKLVETAHVSRSAFYSNYNSLEEVIIEVYKQKHRKHFGDKYKDIKYQLSNEYIWDFINFFDENDKLLLAINKWNLIAYVAKENTKTVISYTNHYDDPMIRDNAEYYVTYRGTQIFNTCYLWIINNKDKTPQELFDMIKYFDHLYYQ